MANSFPDQRFFLAALGGHRRSSSWCASSAFIGFVGYTYVVITKKFDSSRRWDLPSRIYSDATPIVPGMTIPRALLEPKLNHVGYHEVDDARRQSRRVSLRRRTLELYLQNFEYPDIEFRALPVVDRVGRRRRFARSSGSTTASRYAASASSRS